MFHHLNSLYFLFKEVINKQVAPKSILKGSGTRKKFHIGTSENLENIMFNHYSGIGSSTSEAESLQQLNQENALRSDDFGKDGSTQCVPPLLCGNSSEGTNVKNKRVTMSLSKMNGSKNKSAVRNTRKIIEN